MEPPPRLYKDDTRRIELNAAPLRHEGMSRAALLFALCVFPAPAQNQLTVVSAANYQSTISPGSLVSVFGTSLSAVTQSAQLDGSGQLPTQVGGASVTFNGHAAALVYVSPGQINLIVPEDVQPGTAMVSAVSPLATARGTAEIRKVAPALFSSNGNGSGLGSILNAVTYAADPFLVETLENGGNDKRTRLAVYGSGIRLAAASKVTARGRTDSGETLDLPVEYAGPAPGFFGLDQVNVVIPAEADGVGIVHLSVIAETIPSNAVDFTVSSLPANRIGLAGLTLSSVIVMAGDPVSATVLLNAPAPSGGFLVQLSSANDSIVKVQMFVTVPEKALSANVPIQTTSPVSSQDVQITASASGVYRTAVLRVNRWDAPSLSGISVNPASVSNGAPVTGTVTISGSAPLGGVTIALQSDNAALQVPATVTVPFAQTTATFTAAPSTVANTVIVKVTASLDGVIKTTSVTLNPLFVLTLAPDTVTGGSDATGKVTLTDAVSSGSATIQLQSSDITTARVPGSISISAGQLSAQFTVQTTPPVSNRTVSITAIYQGAAQSKPLTVTSGLQGVISKLEIAPATVKGGATATGTVTLARPAGATGIRVSLSSDNPLAVGLDLFVTVPAGMSSATFPIRTSPVASPRIVMITAAVGDTSKTAALTVN